MASSLTVDIEEAQIQFRELLARVAEGTEVILTEQNRPLARLSPIPNAAGHRTADLHPGAFRPSDDFDAPLPDELWSGEQ